MIKQKSFNYQFENNLNELNFFVNTTNFNAFDNLINKKNQLDNCITIIIYALKEFE